MGVMYSSKELLDELVRREGLLADGKCPGCKMKFEIHNCRYKNQEHWNIPTLLIAEPVPGEECLLGTVPGMSDWIVHGADLPDLLRNMADFIEEWMNVQMEKQSAAMEEKINARHD